MCVDLTFSCLFHDNRLQQDKAVYSHALMMMFLHLHHMCMIASEDLRSSGHDHIMGMPLLYSIFLKQVSTTG